MNDLPSLLTNLPYECNTDMQDCDDILDDENPQLKHQFKPQENLLSLTAEENDTAPNEGEKPNSLLTDKKFKRLSFPYLFSVVITLSDMYN